MFFNRRFEYYVNNLYNDLYNTSISYKKIAKNLEKIKLFIVTKPQINSKYINVILKKPYILDGLIERLEKLNLESKKNFVVLLCTIIHDSYGRHYIYSYPFIIYDLLDKYDDPYIGLHVGHILEVGFQYEEIASIVYYSPSFYVLMDCVLHENIEISSSALMNIKSILKNFWMLTFEYLKHNNNVFFNRYNVILQSKNYMIRRISITYIHSLLSDHSQIKKIYVNKVSNLIPIISLLYDKSFQIQIIALKIFCWFVNVRKQNYNIRIYIEENSKDLYNCINNIQYSKNVYSLSLSDFEKDKDFLINLLL